METKKGFKEAFAKFFENPDRVKFVELLKEHSGEYNHIDFKEEWPEKEKLAKHILGFANSRGGVIVIGVKQNKDGSLVAEGLKEIKDKTVIINSIKSYLPNELMNNINILDFSFTETEWGPIKGKKFQVLLVEDTPEKIPFLSMRDKKDIIRKNVVYYRGTVSTEPATHEQLQEIINRRIDTGYSTTKEMEFREHLNQLKELYNIIPKYYNKMIWSLDITKILPHQRNPKYPDEDFEDFILRMIKIKKEIIQKIITGR